MNNILSHHVHATYKIIDISKTQISIVKNSPPTAPKHLGKIMDKQLAHLALSFPPVLVAIDTKSYELIDRAWCYQLQVERQISQILFYVFENRADAESYLTIIAPLINPLIDDFVSSLVKTISKATLARRKAIQAKRQCPFCQDALMKPRGVWTPDKNGFFRSHCFNSKQGRCDCYLLLTSQEMKNFIAYKFDIQEHVKKLPGKVCPKCGKQLYLRIVHLENGTTTHYETCRNYHMSILHSCPYKTKVNGESK